MIAATLLAVQGVSEADKSLNWLQIVPIAALVSAVVTLLVRWFDKPRARLYVEHRLQPGEVSRLNPEWFRVDVRNIGDGAAHDVRVFGSNCDPAVASRRNSAEDAPGWTHQVGTLAAGESVRIESTVRLEDVESAELVVSWTPAPGRTWRRTLRVQLVESDAEFLLPPGVFPPVRIPRWTRRLRTLERISPRAAARSMRSVNDDDVAEDSAGRGDGEPSP
ncbi:hypothetical protein K1X22_21800 [Mycolicibacterium farcinogenes]|uniref:hypothetical protein n=1 Tax=Mycolicibacterium farcinogenes TaxID=1802 RepID=UPI001C8EC131|nr:hypothetical protein [Mycolicibacterium farcinogenes]QZH58864.1 hypothetical protein K1X22_21800 [Mycolicibacterium farcinogenes]